MGLTYFKRYRMELDLEGDLFAAPPCPPCYEFIPYDEELLRDHSIAKYNSFRQELDANVFPCLGRRDGCLRLMREITRRSGFVPESTWLLRFRQHANSVAEPIGTVQGLQIDEWGAIQNLGISRLHRGHGLGTSLLRHAALGFKRVGLTRMHLEVTNDNTAAVRLYERLGFRRAKVVYKAAEVAMA
jgi:ribosomal protein S18 acetylase RimI-like enzyme